MSSEVIRLSVASDRDAILAFIARSGFNPRDAVTWDGLNMQAMTAWLDEALIGAIPFEPRLLRIARSKTIPTIHETVVAVDPDHRGGGLGSRLQSALFSARPFNAQLITVFREDPDSPAYRWYLKNHFSPIIRIDSWFCDRPIATGDSFGIWPASDPTAPWPPSASSPGRVVRDLKPWLNVHPYRNRYSFWIIADSADSLALLGVGTMHSQSQRAEVLEWTAKDPLAAEMLLRAINNAAAENDWHPIRVPLAACDPCVEAVCKAGFQSRWTFDMLARPLLPESNLSQMDSYRWNYAGIDYI